MKLARYVGEGRIEILEEDLPSLPKGGLVVQVEASGLCSGELMSWYMDKKIPHVIGHELAGIVSESEDTRFPVGSRIFPHHHAPDPDSQLTLRGAAVHDAVWKKTKLVPGGMAEFCAVNPENLSDTLICDDLRAIDAALIEPVGCVMKAISRLRLQGNERVAVVGLGFMGIAFSLILQGIVGAQNVVGFDLNQARIDWAGSQGVEGRINREDCQFELVIVCPGSNEALQFALNILAPDGQICLFAPMAPGVTTHLDLHKLYFEDLTLTCSYSCGPKDTLAARQIFRDGRLRAEQVVSHFIELNDLPQAYQDMKEGRILKPMVVFG